MSMRWKLSADVDFILYRMVDEKATRLGVSLSAIVRNAIVEYLERNPTENEHDELLKYPKHGGSLYD